jgi:3-deoxy-D-manno-octulosonic-acid transferase
VETEEALAPLYPCAEVVLPGGTLSPASGLRPDLLTPMAQGRAVLAGPVADAWVRSAAAAGVIATAEDVEALAARLLDLLQDPDATSGLGAAGKVWLEAQVGAAGRVLGRIVK